MSSGKAAAWAGIGVGGALSLAANLAYAYLRNDHPAPRTVLIAVIWPVLLYVALEIFVRPPWPGGWWWIPRAVGPLGVSLVAAVTSYGHMHDVLADAHDHDFAVGFGPIAIDGLMVTSAAALLAIEWAESRTGRTGETGPDRTEQDDLLDRYRALGPEGRAAYARAAEGGPAAEVTPGPSPDGPRTGPGPDSPRTADRPALRSVPETPGRSVPSGGPARATPDQIRTARAACAGLDRPVSGKRLVAAVRSAGGGVANNPALIKELVRAVNHDPDEEESADAAV